MALFSSTIEDQPIEEYQQREDEVVGSLCSLSGGPKVQMEQEKRIRREIANSNERRRMQSINAGFQSLRTLLPHHEGEKLSKAAILQQTAEYIYQLEQEKTRLLSQNCQLKRLVGQQHSPDSDGGSSIDSPLPKRKKIEDNSDEKKPVAPEKVDDASATMEELRKEMIELRVQLDRERRLRMMLEEQIRSMEAQLYPERIREITQQVQLQYQHPGQEEGDVNVKDEPQRTQTPTVVTLTPQQTAVFLQERIPSVLEAAIKAEPRVEVEAAPRVPSPASHVEYTASAVTTIDAVEDVVMTAAVSEPNTTIQVHQELQPAITTAATTTPGVSQSVQPTRVYIANTSRQNLETIVEAIRHLEGDHLFNDEPQRSGLVAPEPAQEIETQEVPLELTTHTAREAVSGDPTIVRVVEDVNMEEIQSAYTVEYSGASVPNRPGVIVVKRS